MLMVARVLPAIFQDNLDSTVEVVAPVQTVQHTGDGAALAAEAKVAVLMGNLIQVVAVAEPVCMIETVTIEEEQEALEL